MNKWLSSFFYFLCLALVVWILISRNLFVEMVTYIDSLVKGDDFKLHLKVKRKKESYINKLTI